MSLFCLLFERLRERGKATTEARRKYFVRIPRFGQSTIAGGAHQSSDYPLHSWWALRNDDYLKLLPGNCKQTRGENRMEGRRRVCFAICWGGGRCRGSERFRSIWWKWNQDRRVFEISSKQAASNLFHILHCFISMLLSHPFDTLIIDQIHYHNVACSSCRLLQPLLSSSLPFCSR